MSKILSLALSPEDFELSGPALLRKTFYPRHRLTITDLSKVLGMSRDRIYKRLHADKLDLKIRQDESKRPFIMLEDLIEYLYPANPGLSPSCHPPEKRKGPGRPRKSTEGGVR